MYQGDQQQQPQPEQQPNQFAMKLPNDPLAFTLSIVGLVLSILTCCCSFFTSIPAVVVSIIAFVQSRNAIQTYQFSPGTYAQPSYKNMKTARLLSIIALVLSILLTATILILNHFMQPFSEQYMNELLERLQEMQRANS